MGTENINISETEKAVRNMKCGKASEPENIFTTNHTTLTDDSYKEIIFLQTGRYHILVPSIKKEMYVEITELLVSQMQWEGCMVEF